MTKIFKKIYLKLYLKAYSKKFLKNTSTFSSTFAERNVFLVSSFKDNGGIFCKAVLEL